MQTFVSFYLCAHGVLRFIARNLPYLGNLSALPSEFISPRHGITQITERPTHPSLRRRPTREMPMRDKKSDGAGEIHRRRENKMFVQVFQLIQSLLGLVFRELGLSGRFNWSDRKRFNSICRDTQQMRFYDMPCEICTLSDRNQQSGGAELMLMMMMNLSAVEEELPTFFCNTHSSTHSPRI